MIIGFPTMYKHVSITLWSLPYIIYALAMGSVFFGLFTIILSTKIKSSEAHNVISNGLFLFFTFVSSAFLSSTRTTSSVNYRLLSKSVNIHCGY